MKLIAWIVPGVALLAAPIAAGAESAQKPAAAPVAEAPKGNAATGSELYTKYGCYQCHGRAGQGGAAGPRLGPSPLPFVAFSQYARLEGGSFGFFKWQTRTSGRRGPASGVLSVSRTLWDGFRQRSEADLRLLNAAVDVDVAERTQVGFRFFGADNPKAQNPGALTPAEYLANPDSAAAGNIRRNADKDVQQYQMGVSLKHGDPHGNSYEVAVFGLKRDLENPLAAPPPQGPGPTIGTYVQIDRLVRILERDHGLEQLLVGRMVEVRRLHLGQHRVDRAVVVEQRRQHRLLRIERVRQHAADAGRRRLRRSRTGSSHGTPSVVITSCQFYHRLAGARLRSPSARCAPFGLAPPTSPPGARSG